MPRGRTAPALRTPRSIAILAVVVGLAALAVGSAGSSIPSFWGDEAASIMSAQRPLNTLFTMLGHVDAVHGTYYLFLHFWIDLFGASPMSVRFPSAIAVGIAAAGVVLLAHRLAGPRAAVFAGVVAIALPRMTDIATEARSSAFSAAIVIWLTYLLVALLAREERRILPWVGYAALLALSLYVFLFSILVIAGHAVIVWFWGQRRRMLRPWLLATLGGLILALPVIVVGAAQRNQIAFLGVYPGATWELVLVGQWFGNIFYASLMALLFAAFVVLLVRARRSRTPSPFTLQRDEQTPPLWLVAGAVAFVPPTILLLATIVTPVYTNRYLSMCAPAIALLVGYLLSLIPRRWGVAALLVVTLAAVPSYIFQRTVYAKNNSDWAPVARYIQTHAAAGDAVVFDETTRPSQRLRLALHAYPDSFAGLVDPTLNVPYTRNTWWWDSTYKVHTVASRFADIDRVWVLEHHLPGEPVGTYALDDLKNLGFRIVGTQPEHTSVIYELTRVRP